MVDSSADDLPEHVRRNRAMWDVKAAEYKLLWLDNTVSLRWPWRCLTTRRRF